jgi:5-formyltetrahydrofolate cyclo-ligase
MSIEKKLQREFMKKKLKELNDMEYIKKSNDIAARLYRNHEWKNSNVIGITISRKREVQTCNIIKKAWELGKEVVVPKCFPEDKRMGFYQIKDFSQVEEVFFGLKEPTPALTKRVEHDEIDLLIVPGVCFSTDGYRIGYGGGYYDRYLENYKGKTVSLLFERQIINSIPIDNFDIPVQQLITESRTIICND